MIDSEKAMWLVNEKKVFKELGYDVNEAFLCTLMGQGKDNTIKSYKKKFGDDFPIDEFYKRLTKLNYEMVDNVGIPYMEGFKELFDYIKTTNIKVTVGTSSNREYVNKVLKNIINEFDSVVCGSDVKTSKPDPEIYIKCISEFGFDPKDVIIFEDAENGALAGLGAGARVIVVKDVAYVSEETKSKVYKYLHSLKDAIKIVKEEYETTTRI